MKGEGRTGAEREREKEKKKSFSADLKSKVYP